MPTDHPIHSCTRRLRRLRMNFVSFHSHSDMFLLFPVDIYYICSERVSKVVLRLAAFSRCSNNNGKNLRITRENSRANERTMQASRREIYVCAPHWYMVAIIIERTWRIYHIIHSMPVSRCTCEYWHLSPIKLRASDDAAAAATANAFLTDWKIGKWKSSTSLQSLSLSLSVIQLVDALFSS